MAPIIIIVVSIILAAATWIWHKQINSLTKKYTAIMVIRYALLIAAVLWTAFLLFMGIGEVTGGDASGSIHLVTAVPFAAIVYLLAKR